jgi:hypothetical protein
MISLKDALPSKRFLLAILGLGLGVVGMLVCIKLLQNNTLKIPGNTAPIETDIQVAERLQNISQKDTDGDGLKDWEEALWDTDPNKADTNDDGVNDFDDIASQRAALQANQDAAGIGEEILTNTDVLARDLYTTIATLSQQGVLEQNKDLITSKIGESVNAVTLYQPFDIVDLRIVTPNKISMNNYLSYMKDIMLTYPVAETDIQNILQSNNDGLVSDQSIVFEKTLQHSLGMLESNDVPTIFQEEHLSLINSFRYLTGTLQAIIHAPEDPLIGMAGVNQLTQTLDSLSLAYQNWYDKIQQIAKNPYQ